VCDEIDEHPCPAQLSEAMTDNLQLLRKFAGSGDEMAFRKLVVRHLDLVYSAALRQLNGDADLAEDDQFELVCQP
jgi:hypothetical protein